MNKHILQIGFLWVGPLVSNPVLQGMALPPCTLGFSGLFKEKKDVKLGLSVPGRRRDGLGVDTFNPSTWKAETNGSQCFCHPQSLDLALPHSPSARLAW